jgi:hypothetical protein
MPLAVELSVLDQHSRAAGRMLSRGVTWRLKRQVRRGGHVLAECDVASSMVKSSSGLSIEGARTAQQATV